MSQPLEKMDKRMVKSGQNPGQYSLFGVPTYNIDLDVKEAMREAVEESGMSREQVADAMNQLAGRYGVRLNNGNAAKLTKDVLDKWMNQEEPGRVIPLRALVVFCGVLSDHRPLEVLARPLGARVVGKKEIAELEYGRAILKEKKARRMRRDLEKEL